MSEKATWKTALTYIEPRVGEASFKTWFSTSELTSCSTETARISVQNVFAKTQLEGKFNTLIREGLAQAGQNPNNIRVEIQSSSVSKRAGISREIPPEKPASASISTSEDSAKKTLESIRGNSPSVAQPNNSLNPKYTFESFITGSCNDLAYTACRAVAENPGVKYNPLFIYGGVGLGKTHLLQAVGNHITKKDIHKKVMYISSETFVKEFLDHIRFKKAGFSDKYRSVDVLIIDDMQFIANKEKTQDEFFHTFNALHQLNKQIIIGSDKPPQSIPTLTDRLKSRFEWGMTVDIQMPDFETRCAILEIKASMSGATLERDTMEYLATNIKSNVRELEGALNQLLAFAEMRGVDPSVDIVEGLIGNVRTSRPQHITAKQIVDKTAKYFLLDTKDLRSPKRNKEIALARQIAMYLLRSELHMSFPKVAEELGRKDHTTAMHSIHKIEKNIKLDYAIREHVSDIKDKLYT